MTRLPLLAPLRRVRPPDASTVAPCRRIVPAPSGGARWVSACTTIVLTLLPFAAAPHAAVTSALHDGTLVLRGDAADDALTIDSDGLGPDRLRVTPENGTTLDGDVVARTFDGVTADVRVALGDGDNELSVFPGHIDGDFVIDGRGGADDVFVGSTHVEGDLLVALGPGKNRFLLADGSGVEGDAVIRGGNDDDDVVFLFSAEVAGDITVTLGEGHNSFNAGDSFRLAGGILRVKGGDGPDFVAIGDDSNVFGGAQLDLGDGENLVVFDFTSVLGDLTIKGGRDRDVVTLGPLSVHGRARFGLGASDNALNLSGGIDRDLLVKCGGGNDTVTLTDGLIVRGDTRFDLGDGANTLTGGFGLFEGTLAVRAKRGTDAIAIDAFGFMRVDRDATFALGDGNNTVSLQETTIAEDLTVKTGRGNDTVLLFPTTTVDGATHIDTGAGTDVIGP